jgi:hypothetical protein
MSNEKLTLHAAMERVLAGTTRRRASYKVLSAEIAKRGLYVRKDGRPAPPNQISARAHRYLELFDTQDGDVILR